MGTRRDSATEQGRTHALLTALRSVPGAWVLVFDRELRCLLGTGEELSQAGLDTAAIEGRELGELHDAERWTYWEPLYRAALRGEKVCVDVDGVLDPTRGYRVDVGPLLDEDGSIVGGLAVAHDISDRRRVAQALGEELEAFNYSVSHDLRAPLRAIDGFSAAVARRNGDQLDEAGRELLGRIRKAVVNMSALIDALLDLSRLSRREMNRERVDLSELARDIADDLRATDPERDIEIVIEDGLTTTGDRELLRIALENLFQNAWKFTSHRDRARIEFACADEHDRGTFVVRDNGAGFEMEGAARLFGPFQRLHRDDEFPGVGVGLATVQRIIRRHGGTIRGDGRVGDGAAFRFDLGHKEGR